jgi:amino acid permease
MNASGFWSRDLKASVAAVAFVILALTIVWFSRKHLGLTESAIVIALVVCPMLVCGIVSGRLTEFSGPGGWGAKFGQVARSPLELASSPIY